MPPTSPDHVHTIVRTTRRARDQMMVGLLEVEECADPKCGWWRSNLISLPAGRHPTDFEIKKGGSKPGYRWKPK